LRGRFRRSFQYQAAYTWSRATDDVSDVFDLAGAFALPQNSITFSGERGPANFDAPHRFTYNWVYQFSKLSKARQLTRVLLGELEIAGSGRLQSGQPFTVNTTIDVNLDGNVTDRLNITNGIVATGDRHQPYRLTTANPLSLLAPFGQDGAIGRNTFRAGTLIEMDLALIKNFSFSHGRKLVLRTEAFNFINRANFGVPVRILEGSGFGKATNTVTPARRIQFGLKYVF
jgi:hypothetical protein